LDNYDPLPLNLWQTNIAATIHSRSLYFQQRMDQLDSTIEEHYVMPPSAVVTSILEHNRLHRQTDVGYYAQLQGQELIYNLAGTAFFPDPSNFDKLIAYCQTIYPPAPSQ
jgi:hypothetical protein